MHIRVKLLLTALTAALALSIGTGTAVALRSLSATQETTLRLASRALTFRSSFVEAICEVTLLKTLSRSIPKLENILMGGVTGVRIPVERCRVSGFGAESVLEVEALRIETGEEWRVTYQSYLGTLPRFIGVKFRIKKLHIKIGISIFGSRVACLYDGEIETLASVNESGRLVSLESTRGENLRKNASSSELCSASMEVRATGAEGKFVELANASLALT
jgi:hypothetical protein